MQKHNEVLLAYLDGEADHLNSPKMPGAATDWLELYARYWLGHLMAASDATGALVTLGQALHLSQAQGAPMADDCLHAIERLARTPDAGRGANKKAAGTHRSAAAFVTRSPLRFSPVQATDA